jgi:DNA-binding Lrp family transcriptional regulator
MTASAIPVDIADPTNRAILAISEDQLAGFQRDPLGEIATASDVPLAVVVERIQAMLEAGTIRRVRQTLLPTNLAHGALVAWQVPESELQPAFDFMSQEDLFSGHVVIRTTDTANPGSRYRLWTTLKVPQGFSLAKHAEHLLTRTGAERYRLMPAKCLFSLGVGHVRRREIEPGERTQVPTRVLRTAIVELDARDWRVVEALKREFAPGELGPNLWAPRAAECGLSLDEFCAVAQSLQEREMLGRFSTFLEHVKSVAGAEPVTRYNALFHWAVPAGREMQAGREVGRHHIMTHAYWREGGPEFEDVNIMGVAHGTDKERLLAHKAAIDAHLSEEGIAVGYTAVFWGGRSEIKPSEIMPSAYKAWCAQEGLDADAMRQSVADPT